jgi:hemerythrin-like domain-containing protein
MTIFTLLKKDHSEVKKLIKKLQQMDESDKGKASLFEKIKNELAAHSHAEEEALYGRLEETDKEKIRLLGFEGGVEHHIVEGLLEAMERMNVEDECFSAAAKVLRELVEQHVKEEESAVFSESKKAFDRDELKMIAEEFLRLKQRELSGAKAQRRQRIPTGEMPAGTA